MGRQALALRLFVNIETIRPPVVALLVSTETHVSPQSGSWISPGKAIGEAFCPQNVGG